MKILKTVKEILNQEPPLLVGVDISNSSIKAMELMKDNNQYSIQAYGNVMLPPNAVVDKNIKDVKVVADALSTLLNSSKFSTQNVAVALSGASVITRVIQIDANLKENEILDQISLEADRYIPYPLEEVNLDFQILGPSKKNSQLMDVMLAAARIETIDAYLEALNMAGLKVKIVEVESFSLERAFSLITDKLPNQGVNQRIALLDIGGATTTLSVFHNQDVIYNRDQGFGGRQLTEEIQRRYSLSIKEALAAQKLGGLPEEYVTEVLEPFRETVAQQINRALEFYYSSEQHGELDYIALVGGTASIPDLDEAVYQRTTIKTIVANPISEMLIGSNVKSDLIINDGPSLMLCCGLAMRSFDK